MNSRLILPGLLTTLLACAADPAAPPVSPPPVSPPPAAPSPAPSPARAATATGAFTSDERAAAESIRPEALAAHIRFLADDMLAGRAPGTPGFELAARYVATELQALGLEPAGDEGTFFQKVDLVGSQLTRAALTISGGSGAMHLEWNRDFVASADAELPRVEVDGELVFVNYGLEVPDYHYDDFTGVDLHGKIAVRFYGAPHSDRAGFFPPLPAAVYGDSERVIADLKRRGAVAVLSVWTPTLEGVSPFSQVINNARFEKMTLAGEPRPLPSGRMTSAAFAQLLQQAGSHETMADLIAAAAGGHPRSFPLGHLRAHLHTETSHRTLTSENVIARMAGNPASPVRDEMVVYGAHLDHMGVGEPVNGDRIYNGASDDAAGVSSLLETARAFTRLAAAPARSIVFLLVTAEERGLLGSRWFARKPTVPMKDIVADIDVDGAYPVNPLKDVIAIGTDESSLGADVMRAARALDLAVSPDPSPAQTYFVRSDNYSFVKRGVPAAQTMNGTAGLTKDEKKAWSEFWEKRYHQPQDEYEPNRDWRPFAQLTRFNFLLGVAIAGERERPTWNAGSWFRRFPEPEN